MLIDTHAHLDYSEFGEDFDEVIARAHAAGVDRIITIGTSLDSSRAAVALAHKYPEIYAVIGVHPNEAMTAPEDVQEPLRILAQSPRVVAIGETGLDYHRLPANPLPFGAAAGGNPGEDAGAIEHGAEKFAQAAIFQQQLDLAVELGLNVVIHQRNAWEDTLEILSPYRGKLRGVFHCFGGDATAAAQVAAEGHLVSFTGIVTFKNAPLVHEAAAAVAEYMVETDCPYLAPVPHRGKRCEPSHTRLVAERIATLRNQTLDEVARETTRTAEAFFRFSR
jgi:TatD DNase family protein